MPKIKCHYDDCVFIEEGHCGAAAVELEPEGGCLTYRRDTETEAAAPEDAWDEDEFEDELEEEEDLYEEEDDEDTWDDDDEDETERY
ncbi:MAG: hypothetical protein KA764_22585 [Anaerolineales bacterium]|nr:hypothetical protein [Anaerolineales bacterium]